MNCGKRLTAAPVDAYAAKTLWENFLVVERRKRNAYAPSPALPYCWRTYTGAELDYVENTDGQLAGFEFKLTRKAN